MSGQGSAEVAFQDASAYFSQEEWKLLHEWQKVLYRNVMKEIHQALLSLGPLIATTVCSLREKEKEDLWAMDEQRPTKRHRIPSDEAEDHDVLYRTNREELPQLDSNKGSQRRQRPRPRAGFPNENNIRLKKEETVPIFIDHLGAEIEESSIQPNSGYELVSLHIKKEDGTYCLEPQDCEQAESTAHSKGDKAQKTKHNEADIVRTTKKAIPRKASPASAKVKIVDSYEKEMQPGGSLWSEANQELEMEESPECERDFSDPTDLAFHPGIPEVQRSETYNDGSSMCHANLFACLSSIQTNVNLFSCTECEKIFSKEEDLIGHKRIHMGMRPYQCTECNKSFRRKDTLFVHKRTHTGERPYHCAVCEKSFNQVGALNRHQRTHLGYRPYQCHQCEKSFSQNGTLIAHQKTHKYPKN
ncbi:zinc finger protein 419-like [Pleurodeles waltl]|uniref:zinc finger protein 419-like n=1 Tax=Pleurodeles waltl TaxID=8319 RepID=UPI003709BBF8